MKNEQLPPNVYQLPQGSFKTINGNPWVYWITNSIFNLFKDLPSIGVAANPKAGSQTSDNFRFLRYWWEVGRSFIGFDIRNAEDSKRTPQRWCPYMKGGSLNKWYGNQEYVVNYHQDGYELKAWADPLYGNSGWSRIIKSTDFFYREGITWSDLSGKGFGVRYLPPGFIFDVKGSSGFPNNNIRLAVMAVMNSAWMGFALGLLNPTVSFQVGDISRVPFKLPNAEQNHSFETCITQAILYRMREAKASEKTFEFVFPLSWDLGLEDLSSLKNSLTKLEDHLDNEVFTLYGFSENDREMIRAEINNGIQDEAPEEELQDVLEDEYTESYITREELAVRWISYAVGILLGRFQPGVLGQIGSAIFRQEDFAKGSLPIPKEQEFEQLIGSKNRAAYFDPSGGWHMFPQRIEQALCDLAVVDGVDVLSENHPYDLVARVRKTLEMMLGENGANEVISTGAGGDLRKFIEKDYFTNYHLKTYRKRPVYWYIQSSKRSYGFVIFHEKITKDTFYAIQREPYLDTKRNAVTLEIQDVEAHIKQSAGGERKKLEKRLAELRDLAEELAQFAKDLEEITRSGYEPEPDWIDDGVILRMAPLWKVIPLWKSEPKKFWERLEAGEFDWSHIAMKYWPKRVRDACRKNKSFAIAHGHEEWYEGK